jgi:heme/copper-type cytochrome/quinol oxidase subunit 2
METFLNFLWEICCIIGVVFGAAVVYVYKYYRSENDTLYEVEQAATVQYLPRKEK